MPSSEISVLVECASEIQATFILSLLEDNDIEAWAEGGNTNSAMGFSGMVAPLPVRVYVRRQNDKEAREILLQAKEAPHAADPWEDEVRSRTRLSYAFYLIGGLLIPLLGWEIANSSSGWVGAIALLAGLFVPVISVILGVWVGKRRLKNEERTSAVR